MFSRFFTFIFAICLALCSAMLSYLVKEGGGDVAATPA
jgi:hypothetical protein